LRASAVVSVTGASSRRREETRFSLKELAERAAAEAERQAIRLALHATRGNKSEAARLLRVDYKGAKLKLDYGRD
jgi:DNA-binding NtrC family response regulator